MENKILLVVDNSVLNSFLTKALSKLSHQLSYPDENVMQKIFDEVPHLIVIDEDYKNGEGRILALSLKEDLVLKYIPIILLVRKDHELPKEKGSDIDCYFEKDQDMEMFLGCVTDILSKNYNELDLNPLTHLPGTRSSVLRIERTIHSKGLFAVCCIDLSDLSAFNKAYGDARGDKIIIKLAEVIQEVIKKHGSGDDFVGHLGGDDFIIVTHSYLAVPISEAVIQNFDAIIPSLYDSVDRQHGYLVQKDDDASLEQYPIMNLSIVIIPNENIPIHEISEVGRIAGELNKYMKLFPGSCYIKYRPRALPAPQESQDNSLEIRFPGKMQSVTVLTPSEDADDYSDLISQVIDGRKIETVYQPIVDLKNKTILGYEALTRSLAGGPFGPENAAALFEMARKCGKIIELDRLCVEFALKNAQTLDPDKKLFLNLNLETLIDPNAMRDLFSFLGNISFKNIVIEVTEQSILRSFEKVRDALLELKEQGVSVAIDDVGGGAVSLRDVAVLKPEYMKFDRSLIRQIDMNVTKQQIILSLILFANGIRAITTAEGIETKREYDTVVMLGVALGQGFYMARPSKPFIKTIY